MQIRQVFQKRRLETSVGRVVARVNTTYPVNANLNCMTPGAVSDGAAAFMTAVPCADGTQTAAATATSGGFVTPITPAAPPQPAAAPPRRPEGGQH